MSSLIGIPILALALILQTAILSHITLLQASADLVLVVVASWIMNERVKMVWPWPLIAGILVGFVSEIPMWGYVLGYLGMAFIGLALKRRVWRAPLLALFTMVFVGTLILQGVTYVLLRVSGTVIDPLQAFNLVLLPGLLLNLVIAVPVQGLINEVAALFYPVDVEG
jgi:cell shape-determining protein MreD